MPGTESLSWSAQIRGLKEAQRMCMRVLRVHEIWLRRLEQPPQQLPLPPMERCTPERAGSWQVVDWHAFNLFPDGGIEPRNERDDPCIDISERGKSGDQAGENRLDPPSRLSGIGWKRSDEDDAHQARERGASANE